MRLTGQPRLQGGGGLVQLLRQSVGGRVGVGRPRAPLVRSLDFLQRLGEFHGGPVGRGELQRRLRLLGQVFERGFDLDLRKDELGE